jgi:hypothetical protein
MSPQSLVTHFRVPGIAVKVVNSYDAASLKVPVKVVKSVDFPTEGNPTKPKAENSKCQKAARKKTHTSYRTRDLCGVCQEDKDHVSTSI